jgi:cyanophycin synthetase
MPVFLKRYVAGDGRIPVEAFVGGSQAMVAGSTRQAALCASGVACFVTSHAHTLDPLGASCTISCEGLFERVLALLMNRQVGALVLVVQTDELLTTGLPVDRLASVQLVQGNSQEGDADPGPSGTALAELLRLLRAHLGTGAHNG